MKRHNGSNHNFATPISHTIIGYDAQGKECGYTVVQHKEAEKYARESDLSSIDALFVYIKDFMRHCDSDVVRFVHVEKWGVTDSPVASIEVSAKPRETTLMPASEASRQSKYTIQQMNDQLDVIASVVKRNVSLGAESAPYYGSISEAAMWALRKLGYNVSIDYATNVGEYYKIQW